MVCTWGPWSNQVAERKPCFQVESRDANFRETLKLIPAIDFTYPKVSTASALDGILSIAKFTIAKGVPRNFGNRQNKIQTKKRLFLFSDLQENTDASAVLEFMKIRLSNLSLTPNTKEEKSSLVTLYHETKNNSKTNRRL